MGQLNGWLPIIGGKMKRYLVALGAATLVGSVVVGSAAALNVDGGVVQSGADTTLSCDANGVTVIPKSEFDAVVPYSTGANVSDIASACEGRNMVVTAHDGSGNQLGQFTVLGIDGATESGNWDSGNVNLKDIERLTVTLIS